ncbi:MAG: putative ABC transporter permease [Lachnospira sp.]|nr:putative ABC transporter permease [Lachnospira sp.]
MYTFYHYTFFFFAYSFLGWIAEEIYAFFRYGKFVNRGFLNGPWCPQYGAAMAVILADVSDLMAYPVHQFTMCVILMAIMQGFAGLFLHRLTGRRMWDYSKSKFNLNGYTSLRSAFIFGAIAAVAVWMINPLLFILFSVIPLNAMKALLVVLSVLMLVDFFVMAAVGLHWKFEGNIYGRMAKGLHSAKKRIGSSLFGLIKRRMYKAFPEMEAQECDDMVGFGRPENRVFAQGITIEKLIWIFMVCAFLGDIIETVFLWIVDGEIMSRSSVLYGPFSIVWGLGGVLITVFLCPVRKWGAFAVFIAGTFLGGVYEYSCSVFTEVVFGTVFWDYSHIPYNINGRINLLYCFFWGFAAIAWVYLLYPLVSRVIEKVPPVMGKVATVLVVVAMLLNAGVSTLAVSRYVERGDGVAPQTAVDVFLDTMYTDEFIDKIYPNMMIK